jgi:transposase InsO family protein
MKDYLSDPGRAVQYGIAKFLWFWNPWDGDRYGMGSSFNVHTGLVCLLSGVAAAVWVRRRASRKPPALLPLEGEAGRGRHAEPSHTVWLLSTLLAYFVFMALVFYGSPRFRMPVEPILWTSAGCGFATLARWPRRLREPLLVLGLGVVFTLYLTGDMAKEVVRTIADATFEKFGDRLRITSAHSLYTLNDTRCNS